MFLLLRCAVRTEGSAMTVKYFIAPVCAINGEDAKLYLQRLEGNED